MQQIVRKLRELLDTALDQHVREDHDRRQVGKLTAVDTTGFRADVQIGGSSGLAITKVPYIKDFTFAVGEYVYVIGSGKDRLIVGHAPLL